MEQHDKPRGGPCAEGDAGVGLRDEPVHRRDGVARVRSAPVRGCVEAVAACVPVRRPEGARVHQERHALLGERYGAGDVLPAGTVRVHRGRGVCVCGGLGRGLHEEGDCERDGPAQPERVSVQLGVLPAGAEEQLAQLLRRAARVPGVPPVLGGVRRRHNARHRGAQPGDGRRRQHHQVPVQARPAVQVVAGSDTPDVLGPRQRRVSPLGKRAGRQAV